MRCAQGNKYIRIRYIHRHHHTIFIALQEPPTVMYSSSKTKQEKYILIEEDIILVEERISTKDSKTPKVIRLRNIANTSTPLKSKTLTRAEVLEALMPLSRTSWGAAPTLISQSPRNPSRP
ncbi:hypothetical protein BGZ46_008384 [Entomortierella lignicola]|nr:hypothetical protein BGZ46_008384 [Entomortierella lignicola]